MAPNYGSPRIMLLLERGRLARTPLSDAGETPALQQQHDSRRTPNYSWDRIGILSHESRRMDSMKIIVIEAWGLHLGYLGCYGNDWVATPHLDRLAAEGVVFDWHYADVPVLDAARIAWRTGRHPFSPTAPVAGHLFELLRSQQMRVWETDFAAAADLRADFTAAADALLWAEVSLLPPWDLSDEQLAPYFEEFTDDEEAPEPILDPAPGELTDDRTFDSLQRTFAAAVTTFD